MQKLLCKRILKIFLCLNLAMWLNSVDIFSIYIARNKMIVKYIENRKLKTNDLIQHCLEILFHEDAKDINLYLLYLSPQSQGFKIAHHNMNLNFRLFHSHTFEYFSYNTNAFE